MTTNIEQRPHVKTDNNANQTQYYVTLVIAIALGMVGVFFRFIQDSFLFTSISNVFIVVASFIAIKTVFKIMK